MKRFLVFCAALLIILAAGGWLVSSPSPAFPRDDWAALEEGGDAERGRIVFDAGGCPSCHATPGQDDRLKLGGGLQLPSPFGIFYVPNISPDPSVGIGGWKLVVLAK